MKRLFIAIPLNSSQTIMERKSEIEKQLLAYKIKWVENHNLHLTISFLGETNRYGDLKRELSKLKIERFSINIGGFGYFKKGSDVSALFLKIERSKDLQNLYNQVISITKSLGFKEEKREYIPHLTFGRVKESSSGLIQNLNRLKGEEIVPFVEDIDKISLVESKLLPMGPQYRYLHFDLD